MNRSIVTTDILDEKIDFEFANNFTGFIAEIDSYDKTNRKAKVQPLGKIETNQGFMKLPVINIPVLTLYGNDIEIIPDYKKGELVYCAPNLLPTYNQSKGLFEIDYSRKNKLENLIVVNGIKKQPSILNPTMEKEGLVITDNQSMQAQFSSSKIELKVGLASTQWVLLGEDTVRKLKDLIDAILNITVMTPVGPSSPVSGMPSNQTALNNIKNSLDGLLSGGVKSN